MTLNLLWFSHAALLRSENITMMNEPPMTTTDEAQASLIQIAARILDDAQRPLDPTGIMKLRSNANALGSTLDTLAACAV